MDLKEFEQNENPLKTYGGRIVGMMKDYGITMLEAITWDFEHFMGSPHTIYHHYGTNGLRNAFDVYMNINEVEDGKFYKDIFFGISSDFMLKRGKE